MSARARPGRVAGFTLIEALVALALFALASMLGYRGLTGILDGRQQLVAEDVRWRALTRLFGLLRSDLEGAADRPIKNNFNTTTLEESFRGDVDSGAGDDFAVGWTRVGAPGSGGLPTAPQRVAWRLRDHRIERLTWDSLDRGPRSEAQVTGVLDGVDEFSLRYLGPVGPSQAWDTRWRQPAHPGLPRAVELTVQLSHGERVIRTFDLPSAQ